MYNKEIFGQRLTELRKKRWKQYKEYQNLRINPYEKFSCCKSQDTLAQALGLERRTIGKWELGTSIPTIDKVCELCNLLNCNIDYLLGAEELVGLSPSLIASHYSQISIDIINRAIEDANYRDFLNHFMHPDNCSALINETTLTAWREYLNSTELSELKEPLCSLVEDIFQAYQAINPIGNYSKDAYKQFLYSHLPESKISFNQKKLDECICIPSCLASSKLKELNISSTNPKSYSIFMDFLANYSFDVLTNKESVTIQREHLGKFFIQLFEKYLAE